MASAEIFWDKDGTLSGNPGESYITHFYPHLQYVDSNCKWLNDTIFNNVTVCSNGAIIRRFNFLYLSDPNLFR